MPHVCILPDVDTSVHFQKTDGSILCAVDAAELDTIIIHCRIQDKNFSPDDPLSMNAWMHRCAQALSQRIGKPISISITSIIIREVRKVMDELKKNIQFEQLWTSPPATESTDSNSSPDFPTSLDSDYCTPTSPASMPIENSECVP